MIILLIILILVFGLGGNFYGNGMYRTPGLGLGGILLLVLVVLWLTGRL